MINQNLKPNRIPAINRQNCSGYIFSGVRNKIVNRFGYIGRFADFAHGMRDITLFFLSRSLPKNPPIKRKIYNLQNSNPSKIPVVWIDQKVKISKSYG